MSRAGFRLRFVHSFESGVVHLDSSSQRRGGVGEKTAPAFGREVDPDPTFGKTEPDVCRLTLTQAEDAEPS